MAKLFSKVAIPSCIPPQPCMSAALHSYLYVQLFEIILLIKETVSHCNSKPF